MADRTLRVSLSQQAPSPLQVAFTCRPGEVLGIFGPSGSGKTTILRAIAGLHRAAEAHVEAGDEEWEDTSRGLLVPPHRRAIGFVFQDYALFPHLTALGNVVTALGHLPRRERRRRAEELLELVHLYPQRHHRPGELSGGERQRVAVARALARDPAALLLDEPFSAVDRVARVKLHDEIDEVRSRLDVPVVLVTHDFEDIVRLATHLLVLRDGRSVAAGPIQEVTSRPESGFLAEAVGHGAVFDARVARKDPSRGLAELAFEGGTLVAPDHALVEGTGVRVRVPAREVILAAEEPRSLSLHNVLGASVVALEVDARKSEVVVRLAVGSIHLLAAVTRDAVQRLGIVEGKRLYALIKSVSLEIRARRASSTATARSS